MKDEFKSPPSELGQGRGSTRQTRRIRSRQRLDGRLVGGGGETPGRRTTNSGGQPPLRLASIIPPAWRGHVPSDGTGGESLSAAKRRKRHSAAKPQPRNQGRQED